MTINIKKTSIFIHHSFYIFAENYCTIQMSNSYFLLFSQLIHLPLTQLMILLISLAKLNYRKISISSLLLEYPPYLICLLPAFFLTLDKYFYFYIDNTSTCSLNYLPISLFSDNIQLFRIHSSKLMVRFINSMTENIPLTSGILKLFYDNIFKASESCGNKQGEVN